MSTLGAGFHPHEEKAFLEWLNHHLQRSGLCANNTTHDLYDGFLLSIVYHGITQTPNRSFVHRKKSREALVDSKGISANQQYVRSWFSSLEPQLKTKFQQNIEKISFQELIPVILETLLSKNMQILGAKAITCDHYVDAKNMYMANGLYFPFEGFNLEKRGIEVAVKSILHLSQTKPSLNTEVVSITSWAPPLVEYATALPLDPIFSSDRIIRIFFGFYDSMQAEELTKISLEISNAIRTKAQELNIEVIFLEGFHKDLDMESTLEHGISLLQSCQYAVFFLGPSDSCVVDAQPALLQRGFSRQSSLIQQQLQLSALGAKPVVSRILTYSLDAINRGAIQIAASDDSFNRMMALKSELSKRYPIQTCETLQEVQNTMTANLLHLLKEDFSTSDFTNQDSFMADGKLIPRANLVDSLESVIQVQLIQNKCYAILNGESGSGKSHVLRELVHELKKQAHEMSTVSIFINDTSSSETVESISEKLWVSTISELQLESEASLPKVSEYSRLGLHGLFVYLSKVIREKKICFVIDGIDKLHSSKNHTSPIFLGWIPRVIPQNMALIVSSSIDTDASDVDVFHMYPLTENDVAYMLSGTAIEADCDVSILSWTLKFPWKLKIMLHDLQTCPKNLLTSQTRRYHDFNRTSVYEKICFKLKDVYGPQAMEILRMFSSLLLVSHFGLTENELDGYMRLHLVSYQDYMLWKIIFFDLSVILRRSKHRYLYLNKSIAAEVRDMHHTGQASFAASTKQLGLYLYKNFRSSVSTTTEEILEICYHLSYGRCYRELVWFISDGKVLKVASEDTITSMIGILRGKWHQTQFSTAIIELASSLMEQPAIAQAFLTMLLDIKDLASVKKILASETPMNAATAEGRLVFARCLLATSEFKFAKTVLENLLGEIHDNPKFFRESISAHAELAKAFHQLKDQASAIAEMKKSIALAANLCGEQSLLMADLYDLLGSIQNNAESSPSSGVKSHQKACNIRQKLLGPHGYDIIYSYNHLAEVMIGAKRYEEAEAYLCDACSVLRMYHGPKHADVASTLLRIAVVKHQNKRYSDALNDLEAIVSFYSEPLGSTNPIIKDAYKKLADIHFEVNNFEEIIRIHGPLIEIQKRVDGVDHPSVAALLERVGMAHFQLKRPTKADQYFKEASHIRRISATYMNQFEVFHLLQVSSLMTERKSYGVVVQLLKSVTYIEFTARGYEDDQPWMTCESIDDLLIENKMYEDGVFYWTEMYDTFQMHLGPTHRRTQIALCLSQLYTRMDGKQPPSCSLVDDVILARAMEDQAYANLDMKRESHVHRYLERSASLRRQTRSIIHIRSLEECSSLSEKMEAIGCYDAATQLCKSYALTYFREFGFDTVGGWSMCENADNIFREKGLHSNAISFWNELHDSFASELGWIHERTLSACEIAAFHAKCIGKPRDPILYSHARGFLLEHTNANIDIDYNRDKVIDGLFQVIKSSQNDESKSQVSSIAATLLSFMGASFAGVDLALCHMPYANLSRAVLDGANLTGADLRGAKLKDACLGDCILDDCNMSEVSVGIATRELKGHTADVRSVCYLDGPEGSRWLVSAGSDRIIRIWDLGSGEQLKAIEGHGWSINCVCSFRGVEGEYLLASAAEDRTARVWDLVKGSEIVCFSKHTDAVCAVCPVFNAGQSDRLVASGGRDNIIHLWDAYTGQVKISLAGHTRSVNVMICVQMPAISSSDAVQDPSQPLVSGLPTPNLVKRTVLVSGSYDRTVRLWEVSTGKLIQTLSGHTWYVKCLTSVISPTGALWIASGGGDKTVRVWNAEDGKELMTLRGHGNWINSLCHVRTRPGTVCGTLFCEKKAKEEVILASAGCDRSVILWDLAHGGVRLKTLKGRHTDHINSVDSFFGPGGETMIASAGADKAVLVWDLSDGDGFKGLAHGGDLHELYRDEADLKDNPTSGSAADVIIPETRSAQLETLSLAVSSLGGDKILAKDAISDDKKQSRSRSKQSTAKAESGMKAGVGFGASNKSNSSGNAPSKSTTNPARLQSGTRRERKPISAMCSIRGPNGESWLVTANGNRAGAKRGRTMLGIWDLETGVHVRELDISRAHNSGSEINNADGVSSICKLHSSDGAVLLAVGCGDGKICIVDVVVAENSHSVSRQEKKETVVGVIQAHGGAVRALCALSGPCEERWVGSGGADGIVVMWEVSSGRSIWRREGMHSNGVNSVYSWQTNSHLPNHSTSSVWWMASGSADGVIVVWNGSTGQEFRRLEGHGMYVTSLCVFQGMSRTSSNPSGVIPSGSGSVMEGGKSTLVKVSSSNAFSSAFSEKSTYATTSAYGDNLMETSSYYNDNQSATGISLPTVTNFSNGNGEWWLACGSFEDNTLRIWSVGSGEQIFAIDGHTEGVTSLCTLHGPDGEIWLASGSSDRTVRIWDLEKPDPVERKALERHTDAVTSVCGATGPNGECWLASACADGAIRIWDIQTFASQGRQTKSTSLVRTRSISAFCQSDGTALIASAHGEKSVRIWDPIHGTQHSRIGPLPFPVRTICTFSSPQGRAWIATSGMGRRGSQRIAPTDGGLVPPKSKPSGGEANPAHGSDYHEILLWDVETGTHISTLSGHSNIVLHMSTWSSNDGMSVLLASASADNSVRLWRVFWDGKFELLHVLAGHTDAVQRVSFCQRPEGKETRTNTKPSEGDNQHEPNPMPSDRSSFENILVISAGNDKTVRVWSASTGSVVRVLKGHRDNVMALCVAHHPVLGAWIVSGGRDRMIRLWSLSNLSEGRVLRELNEPVLGLCWLEGPNGESWIAASTLEHVVHIWGFRTGSLVRTLVGNEEVVTDICTVPSSKGQCRVASISQDKTLRVWDLLVPGPEPAITMNGQPTCINDVCTAKGPQGETWIASASDDKTVRIWDVSTGEEVKILCGHSNWVTCVQAIHSLTGESLLASGSYDKTVRIWDLSNGRQKAVLEGHSGWVNAVCWIGGGSGNSSTWTDKHNLEKWTIGRGVESDSIEKHPPTSTGTEIRRNVDPKSFVQNQKSTLRLASGGDDKTIRIWQQQNDWVEVCTLFGHDDYVNALCQVSGPNGELWLASGSDDQTIRLWDIDAGSHIKTLVGHENWVTSLCTVPGPNGEQWLASGSDDRTIRVWDLRSGICVHVMNSQTGRIKGLCVVQPTPKDSPILISGGSDKIVRLWDLNKGRALQSLYGHTGSVRSVCVVARENTATPWIASAGGDKIVRLWDFTTRCQIAPFQASLVGSMYGGTRAAQISMTTIADALHYALDPKNFSSQSINVVTPPQTHGSDIGQSTEAVSGDATNIQNGFPLESQGSIHDAIQHALSAISILDAGKSSMSDATKTIDAHVKYIIGSRRLEGGNIHLRNAVDISWTNKQALLRLGAVSFDQDFVTYCESKDCTRFQSGMMALAYATGILVPKDTSKALLWAKRAGIISSDDEDLTEILPEEILTIEQEMVQSGKENNMRHQADEKPCVIS